MNVVLPNSATGFAPASWTAVAERSGDTAFGAARRPRSRDARPAAEKRWQATRTPRRSASTNPHFAYRGTSWWLETIEAINNSKAMVGTGWFNGKRRGYLLTPLTPGN